jgi:hypothetical protein
MRQRERGRAREGEREREIVLGCMCKVISVVLECCFSTLDNIFLKASAVSDTSVNNWFTYITL